MAHSFDFDTNALIHQISGLNETETLSFLAKQFSGEITFSTNFGLEDQVIAHLLFSNDIPVEIFTIDTGRLFEETYRVWSHTNRKYNTTIKAYYPQYKSLQEFIETNGPDAFYDSKELRLACCFIRKTEPLQRALKSKSLLITGLRKEHLPVHRHATNIFEWDKLNNVIKYHPLFHWTSEQVNSFIYTNDIPYNALHSKGFVNIGCAPCTRAIKPGEAFNAANWWWEKKTLRENENLEHGF